ncbi:adaptin N terminal region-domain-containing protein [Catenaria anguillulae PL171]|uniref:Adaptin N terminal region-domain-containing protein n=1 Tax=Catenaria anguillulae PL171 TaxID=765915 RepID=A0A1Y2HJ15_9FUNG|nr:adaptin N terminal region-domain-containing protein [Catenaria anguillulae PL171]
MFEKSLSDVIRGIRACPTPDQVDEYIHACIAECRREVSVPSDPHVNAGAVLKLAYLHMMGYSADWASFHILKCMSLAPFPLKLVGYLAAQLIFTPKTDVLMLTTNQLKKDLAANNNLDSSLAVATLSEIVTKDLAGDLAHDLVAKANHFNPHTRRRVLLALYRTVVAAPDLSDLVVPHLTQLIQEAATTDPGVVSCAVSVVCELALADPAAYLPLAPHLFGLLTSSGNNWMLIKLVKVFAQMCHLEPRLAKKLGPPLADLIRGTRAMSLQYECINAALLGGLTRHPSVGPTLAPLCRDTLVTFLVHRDANLRYVGLVATEKLVTYHADLVTEQLEDAVFECLEAAMDVLAALVTPANLMDVVAHLLKSVTAAAASPLSASPADMTDDGSVASPPPPPTPTMDRKTASVILDMLTRSGFALVTDIEWLVATLIHLATDPAAGTLVGAPLAAHLMDLALRGGPNLPMLRPLLVTSLLPLLTSNGQSTNKLGASVVWAAVCWIVGEYVSEGGVDPGLVLESLVATKVPSDAVRHVWVQAVAKVGTVAMCQAARTGELIGEGGEAPAEMNKQVNALVKDLSAIMEDTLRVSENAEAVERAQTYLAFLSTLTTCATAPTRLLTTMLQIYFGTSLPVSSLLTPSPLPPLPAAPPVPLDDWLSPAAEAFFNAPPEPVLPTPTPDPDPEPLTAKTGAPSQHVPSTASTVLVAPPQRSASAPGSRSTSPVRARVGRRTSVKSGSSSGTGIKHGSRAGSSGGASTKSMGVGGVDADVVVDNEDMRLSVTLAPPRAPPSSAPAASAAHFAFFLPLTVTFTPKHALCPPVHLHLSHPPAMVATGTRDGLLLSAPTAEKVTKLVLIKLRKAAAQDTLGHELVVSAVLAAGDQAPSGQDVVLAAHVPVHVPHLMTDPTGTSAGDTELRPSPDAFEAKLLAPDAAAAFAHTATGVIAAPAHTQWVHVAKAARMYLVEVVGESATMWGNVDLGQEGGEPGWIAAMVKMVSGEGGVREIRMQVKAGSEWVARGVVEGVRARVGAMVEAGMSAGKV